MKMLGRCMVHGACNEACDMHSN